MSGTVRIVCTSERHAGREVHVAAFAHNDETGEGWHEVTRGKPRLRRGGGNSGDSGETLYGNRRWEEVPTAETFEDEGRETARNRWVLECRKCHRPVALRNENLMDILGRFDQVGIRLIALDAIAASVGRSQ